MTTSQAAHRRVPARVVGRFPSAIALSALVLTPAAVAGQAPVAQDRAAVSINTENVAATTYHTGTQTIGYSAQHRAITLTIVGSPTAAKRAMFIGAIHGNERGGVPITNTLRTSTPPPGVAYFVISLPNPDGAALNTRQNARRVDLNRNFPGWRPTPRGVYYSGTGALSEPESKVMYAAITQIRPTLFVTYHQHMNNIDYGGGNKAAQATYARLTLMRPVQLTRYPGSQATWIHAAYPSTTVMTVELPSSMPSSMVARHVAAAKYLAAHH